MNKDLARFNEDGFAIFKGVLNKRIIENLIEAVENLDDSAVGTTKKQSVYGVRNLLNVLPEIRGFSESKEVRDVAEKILGRNTKVVRAIYFDKTPEVNWKVPPHQDLTISVKEKRETAGFSAWTIKAEIQHVQPTVEILENMLALRFHLDDSDETNGALKIVPKSHGFGRLDANEIKNLCKANKMQVCRVKQGDCLAMRPLLIHSSSVGSAPKRRRVIHLEFSGCDLPNGLNWYGS